MQTSRRGTGWEERAKHECGQDLVSLEGGKAPAHESSGAHARRLDFCALTRSTNFLNINCIKFLRIN